MIGLFVAHGPAVHLSQWYMFLAYLSEYFRSLGLYRGGEAYLSKAPSILGWKRVFHSFVHQFIYFLTGTLRAWQVHAYAAAPGGRTAYLAELKSGLEVVVADAQGRQRTAIVGRVKVERRPLVRSIPRMQPVSHLPPNQAWMGAGPLLLPLHFLFQTDSTTLLQPRLYHVTCVNCCHMHVTCPGSILGDQWSGNRRCFTWLQVLLEAETMDGQEHSLLLQNAETVRLVGPS